MADGLSEEEVALCDALRGPAQATEPDARSEFFAVAETTGSRKTTLMDSHEDIHRFLLNAAVPHSIRVHFETAKNLYLYAWFVYRFYPVAEQQALTSLEFALRERLVVEGAAADARNVLGLSGLLKKAKKRGLIRNEDLCSRVYWASDLARQRYQLQLFAQMNQSGATEMVFDDSGIQPTEQDLAHDWIGTFIESLPKIRNAYAHGSGMLHPTVLRTFDIACDLINQLYPTES